MGVGSSKLVSLGSSRLVYGAIDWCMVQYMSVESSRLVYGAVDWYSEH